MTPVNNVPTPTSDLIPLQRSKAYPDISLSFQHLSEEEKTKLEELGVRITQVHKSNDEKKPTFS